MRELSEHRWKTYGIDLSYAMLQEATRESDIAVAQADMCQLPFQDTFALATCFFDSLNFVTEPKGLGRAFASMSQALNDIGVLYFDVITERMVLDFFADRDWVDSNDGFKTRWSGSYDAENRLITNTIRVNEGIPTVVHERIHTQAEVEAALEASGFTLLGVMDTETWRVPDEKTLRLDFVATLNTDDIVHLKFESIQSDVQALLAD